MYFEAIDDAITLHLRKTGKTQDQLADEMGMAANTFSWKRRGTNDKEFSTSESLRLCAILDIDIDDLMREQIEKFGWPKGDPEPRNATA